MMRVTRRYRFAASHRLHSDRFTEGENRELYGKCNNPFGHGHDYVLDVCVAGPLNPATGLVVNIQVLDALVRDQILREFDHHYLNLDVQEFGSLIPTSENILTVMEQRLRQHWESAFPGERSRLENIGLRETRRNSFELKASER